MASALSQLDTASTWSRGSMASRHTRCTRRASRSTCTVSSGGGGASFQGSPIFGRGVTGFRFVDAQYPRLLVESGVVGFAAFAWLARPLNLLSLGADSAESRGLDVATAHRAAFFGRPGVPETAHRAAVAVDLSGVARDHARDHLFFEQADGAAPAKRRHGLAQLIDLRI